MDYAAYNRAIVSLYSDCQHLETQILKESLN
jgi:hypothetical protein